MKAKGGRKRLITLRVPFFCMTKMDRVSFLLGLQKLFCMKTLSSLSIYVIVMGIIKCEKVWPGILFFQVCENTLFDLKKELEKLKITAKTFLHARHPFQKHI